MQGPTIGEFLEERSGEPLIFCQETPVIRIGPWVPRKAILVVDEEPKVAEMLADLLRLDDHHVDVAPNGRDALARPHLLRRVILLTGDALSVESIAFLERALAPHTASTS